MSPLFKTTMPVCPTQSNCSRWARTFMKYCLCSVKDGVSLSLGVISVVSWGVAEVPQIITNYREKSTQGLSIAFLATWIIGDLLNLAGCLLEPATLPTQYYMALLYTATTTMLTAQTIYYTHIYDKLKSNKWSHKAPNLEAGDRGPGTHADNNNICRNGLNVLDRRNNLSSPIPFPVHPQNISPGRELYYVSARSLSSSHTPTSGSFLAPKMTPPSTVRNSLEEPLLDGVVSTLSAPNMNAKTMLCVVSLMTFLGMFTVHQSANNRLDLVVQNSNQGFVLRLGRKIMQVGGGMYSTKDNYVSSEVGNYLGWAMAAIYMGGRLPQICLNVKRGNVEGLNPLMFVFALIGNTTYMASILVSSVEWSKIRPNLPWLVDAGGCVLLDTFIMIQFIYFHYGTRKIQTVEDMHQKSRTHTS